MVDCINKNVNILDKTGQNNMKRYRVNNDSLIKKNVMADLIWPAVKIKCYFLDNIVLF